MSPRLALLLLVFFWLCGCDQSAYAWEQARKQDSEEAYLAFQEQYPESVKVTDAAQALTQLRCKQARESLEPHWREHDPARSLFMLRVDDDESRVAGGPIYMAVGATGLGSINVRGEHVSDPRANDPWGNPYLIELRWDAQRSENETAEDRQRRIHLYALSTGPDGERGTTDDIRYPEESK